MQNPNSKQIKQPLREGDSECWNCAGINFISDELAKKGLRPTCYGFHYKASVKISDDAMKKLEYIPPIPPNTKIFMFGLSQASTRMYRLGQVPVLKYGIPVVIKYELIEKNDESSNSDSFKAQDPLRPPDNNYSVGSSRNSLQEGIATRRPLPNDHPATLSPDGSRSSQISSKKTDADNSLPAYPSSSENSLSKVGQSLQRSSLKLWYDSREILGRLPFRAQQSLDRLQVAAWNRISFTWSQLHQRLFTNNNRDDSKGK